MLRRVLTTILSSSSNLHIVIIGLVKGPALKDETIRENLWKGECTVHLLHVSDKSEEIVADMVTNDVLREKMGVINNNEGDVINASTGSIVGEKLIDENVFVYEKIGANGVGILDDTIADGVDSVGQDVCANVVVVSDDTVHVTEIVAVNTLAVIEEIEEKRYCREQYRC